MLFSFHLFGDVPALFLLLISVLIPVLLENTLYNFNSLKLCLRELKSYSVNFVLWLKIWSILVYVLWALEKNMFSAVVGWNAL